MPKKSNLETAAAAVAKKEDALLKRAAAARQRNLLRTREGEWTLKIALSLVPSGGTGVPGDDEQGNDPRDDEQGNDPRDDEQGNDPHSKASIIMHAPIELRGADIEVHFATHAAEKVRRAKRSQATGKDKNAGKGQDKGTSSPQA